MMSDARTRYLAWHGFFIVLGATAVMFGCFKIADWLGWASVVAFGVLLVVSSAVATGRTKSVKP
jgi:hypothetical protein